MFGNTYRQIGDKTVLNYGAIGDLLTDNGAAFQAAVSSEGVGQNTVVPWGGYYFETGYTADVFYSLTGTGREGSNLYGRPSLVGALLSLPIGGFHIKDILFVMENAHPAIKGTAVLTDGLLENLWFTGGDTEGTDAMFECFGNNLTITGCNFEATSHAIKFFGGQSTYIIMSNTVFWNVSNTNIEFEGTSPSFGINMSNLLVESKHVEDTATAAIVFKNCKYVNLSNVIFSRCADSPEGEQFVNAVRFEDCDVVNMNNVITDGFCSGEAFDVVTSTNINKATVEAVT